MQPVLFSRCKSSMLLSLALFVPDNASIPLWSIHFFLSRAKESVSLNKICKDHIEKHVPPTFCPGFRAVGCLLCESCASVAFDDELELVTFSSTVRNPVTGGNMRSLVSLVLLSSTLLFDISKVSSWTLSLMDLMCSKIGFLSTWGTPFLDKYQVIGQQIHTDPRDYMTLKYHNENYENYPRPSETMQGKEDQKSETLGMPDEEFVQDETDSNSQAGHERVTESQDTKETEETSGKLFLLFLLKIAPNIWFF